LLSATDFTPVESLYQSRLCYGIKITLVDRDEVDALGIEIATALYRLYPAKFQIDKIAGMVGTRWVIDAIKDGKDPTYVVQRWQSPLQSFLKMREKYLLY
jgi:uncharacterized protein YbbC (DUF1343 family)